VVTSRRWKRLAVRGDVPVKLWGFDGRAPKDVLSKSRCLRPGKKKPVRC